MVLSASPAAVPMHHSLSLLPSSVAVSFSFCTPSFLIAQIYTEYAFHMNSFLCSKDSCMEISILKQALFTLWTLVLKGWWSRDPQNIWVNGPQCISPFKLVHIFYTVTVNRSQWHLFKGDGLFCFWILSVSVFLCTSLTLITKLWNTLFYRALQGPWAWPQKNLAEWANVHRNLSYLTLNADLTSIVLLWSK